MSEESTIRDPREIALQMAEALSRTDFDAYMSHFAHDAVWQSRFGIRLEGTTAIRSYTEEFNGSVDGYRAEVLEVVDLGGDVILLMGRQEVARAAARSNCSNT
jgi:ketosteroid isomerase-like protein